MVNGDCSAVLRHVRALFGAGAAGGMSDGQLLEKFRRQVRDAEAEAAFAVLVARHGPMVFGVCRRMLRDPNDAADAFQATFLVLVRKAGSVRVDDSLGRWLYGVSRRVAAKAKAARIRRTAHEGSESRLELAAPDSAEAAERRELLAALDEEVARLPEPFRSAVVLCDLGGLPQDAAAQQFGCAVGTVESRLSRGRKRLREQLARRGLAPMIVGGSGFAPPAVPEALCISTTLAAARPATVSAFVSTLVESVITEIAWTKIKTLVLGLGAVTVACGLGITAAQRLQAEDNLPDSPARTATAPAKPRGAAALLSPPAAQVDPAQGDWVGKQVITKLGTVLKGAPRAVDDPRPEAKLQDPYRDVFRFYQVEKASGPWLRLVAEKEDVRAWVPVSQVVPSDRLIDYFTGVIRADPKSGLAYRSRGIVWKWMKEYDKAIADDTEAIRIDPENANPYVLRGDVWEAKHEHDKAVADYTAAIQIDGDAFIYTRRGEVWVKLQQLDKAIADYNEAIRIDPGNLGAYNARGWFWYHTGEHDKAIADFNHAIQLDPQDPVLYIHRGNVWHETGDFDKALDDYNQAIRLQPTFSAAYNDRGNTWRAKGDHDKAIADFNHAIALDPQNFVAYFSRGNYWSERREHEKAAADFSEAIRLEPTRAAAYINRGNAWRARGNGDRAIADYEEAIRLDPQASLAFSGRALVWHDEGEYDKAIADWTEAIRLDPRNASGYNGRGLAWYDKDDLDKAVADFDEAIRLDPHLAQAYVNRGIVLELDLEFDKALVEFNEAIRLDATAAPAYSHRGDIWFHNKDFDKAIADYNEAIGFDPTDAKASYYRGASWYWKGQYDKAIADCATAIRIDPENPNPYILRGVAWEAKGEYDKAIADHSEAIRVDPEYAHAYYTRGLAWSKKREYDKAIADYSEAIRIDPKHAEAYNKCAWIWATCSDARHRDGKRAVESATQACALTDRKDADKLGTLAAAYAQAGSFDEAVVWQKKAMENSQNEEDRQRSEARLTLFQAKKPYRQVPGAE